MKNIFLTIIVFVFVVCSFQEANAQSKMAITITPPLIKNNVSPGQIWKSYIKVVNNNAENIDIYVELVNFESGNESGTVRLVPKSTEEVKANELLVNNWIHIDRGPINVPAFKGKDIPFIVDVPDNADPGDHHLAILVGTEPNKETKKGSSIKVSSKIGSLLLLNVGGDVKENGIMREFSTNKQFYSNGNVDFSLRFQNTGNTILQPRGEIRIYDWQEKEREVIKVNHKTNTGNVFPKDIRLWKYNWQVPVGILDMGKYKAEMVLTYGNKTPEVVERTVYFWVVQWRLVLTSLAIITIIILLMIFFIRRSIKKAVIKTQEQIKTASPQIETMSVAKTKTKNFARKVKKEKNTKKVNKTKGIVDLKASSKNIRNHEN